MILLTAENVFITGKEVNAPGECYGVEVSLAVMVVFRLEVDDQPSHDVLHLVSDSSALS